MAAARRRKDRPIPAEEKVNEPMTEAEFDQLFHDVSNWGRWGEADQKGTLNYITPDRIKNAALLVRSGRSVSMAREIDTVTAVDNPDPAIHHMIRGYDIPAAEGEPQFVSDYLGCGCHGNADSHIDALCHVAYKGRLYNNRPLSSVTSRGADVLDITTYGNGIVGRGVLLDIPRLRGSRWLEPGDAVTSRDLKQRRKHRGCGCARETCSSSASGIRSAARFWDHGTATTVDREGRDSTQRPCASCTNGRLRRSSRTATARPSRAESKE